MVWHYKGRGVKYFENFVRDFLIFSILFVIFLFFLFFLVIF